MSDQTKPSPAKPDTRTPNEKLGVELGMTVHWFDGGDTTQEPKPAVVTGVAFNGLNLNIFDKANYNLSIRDGVRHVADPTANEQHKKDDGAWDFTPRDKRLNELLESLMK